MGFYQRRVLPWILDATMRQGVLDAYRRRVAGAADGRVLEIGLGSGLNLQYYGAAVAEIIGLDPSAALLTKARRARTRAGQRVTIIEGSAEALPLTSGSLDTVVTTWTLCSIPHVSRALAEARRVLRPGGQLLFVEHGVSPDPAVTRWQDRLTPIWKRIAGGCHLNRPIEDLVKEAGFRIEQIDAGYMEGPKPLTYMYEGRARR
jgi:ubiquinone/menaquinone biosynthesis C-methylase UbiE